MVQLNTLGFPLQRVFISSTVIHCKDWDWVDSTGSQDLVLLLALRKFSQYRKIQATDFLRLYEDDVHLKYSTKGQN